MNQFLLFNMTLILLRQLIQFLLPTGIHVLVEKYLAVYLFNY